jgi:hypothetical protein
MSKAPVTITVAVNDVKLDPEDELYTSFNKATVNYYVYINMDLVGTCTPENGFRAV